MTYEERRKKACQELFEGFEPDVSGSRYPDEVLKVRDLAATGMYTKEIAEVIGKSPKAVQKIYRRYNFPDLQNFCPRVLEEKKNWKGGTKLMKGYIYKIVPDHPNGTTHGNYVALHRLVMEEKLGRYLTKKEVVDHIDGDITNNHPDNLRVFESNAEHLRVTLKGKCPNWSEEGRKKLLEAVRKPKKKRSANHP